MSEAKIVDTAPPATRWMNTRECATYSRHSVRSLEDRRRLGSGPRCHYVGSKPLYDRNDVDEWIRSGAPPLPTGAYTRNDPNGDDR